MVVGEPVRLYQPVVVVRVVCVPPVPPLILEEVPAPELPSLTQVVTKVNTVELVAVAVVRMNSVV
jgi:hypothetical protein